MKKRIVLWLMAVAILAAGCVARPADTQQTIAADTQTTTEITTAATAMDTQAVEETTAVTESVPEDTQAPQTEPAQVNDGLDDYMASLKAQSDSIKASLEQDELNQAEMNQKSQELYVLWDDALNDLWAKLQDHLPEDEFDELLDEQIQWIEDKESAVEDAGKDFEGGSIYPLITNAKAAELTEARVYEFYQLLKQQ